jgi:heme/copper-type cytochrome/quinol oxidase subunit 3
MEGSHHASIWPLVVALGAGVAFGGVITFFPLVLVGLVVFVAGVAGWLLQDARGVRFGEVVTPTEPGIFRDVSVRKLGMWIFIVSEIMFFSAIIGASLALRAREATWPIPGETSPLNIPLTAVNTFILITSSFTMVQALKGIEKGNLALFRGALLATLALGITFVSIQGYEYNKLFFVENLTPWKNAIRPDLAIFGTTFYMQTGFHGAHVTGGVVGLAYLNYKAWKKDWFTPAKHEAVELVGLYWHFVDVVWIFLFPLVYLI